jgi:hypothetical protein
MLDVLHSLNWYAGWALVLAGFAAGAVVGLGFHREDFLGGYTSFRRRIIRLGHIALVALGVLNLCFATLAPASSTSPVASILFVIGGIAMPTVCFLSGWKPVFRHLFFIPVLSLMGAVILVLIGGLP